MPFGAERESEMDITHLDEYLRKKTENERSSGTTYHGLISKLTELPVRFDIDPMEFLSHPDSDFKLPDGMSIPDSMHYLGDMFSNFRYVDGILAVKQDRFADVVKHKHDWIELVYMYSGRALLTVHEREITLTKGQALLINSNVEHSCKACGEDDILINFLIRRNYLNQNFFNRFSDESYLSQLFIQMLNDQETEEHYVFFHSEDSRRLPIFVREFLCEYFDKSIHSKDYIDSYTTLILLELAEVFGRDLKDRHEKSSRQYVLPILRYIEENFSYCSLKTAAEFFHLNPNYLSNYIKKHTGNTFKSLVQNQKLLYAEKLLKNTALPVTEVSNQAGYENVSFFYKKFREKYQCSPQEYRIRSR